MIIFGSRGIRMKAGEGSFHCPHCAGTRQYTQRRMRRFFTLYFIPLIPLDNLGEYVECNTCHGQFNTSVLTYDPRADQQRVDSQLRTTINRALLSVLVADGEPSSAARDLAVEGIRSTSGDTSMTRASLDEQVQPAMKRVTNPTNDLAAVAESMDYSSKEALIQAAIAIATADGSMSSAEERQIRALAVAVGITPAHLTGILATAGPRQLGSGNGPA